MSNKHTSTQISAAQSRSGTSRTSASSRHSQAPSRGEPESVRTAASTRQSQAPSRGEPEPPVRTAASTRQSQAPSTATSTRQSQAPSRGEPESPVRNANPAASVSSPSRSPERRAGIRNSAPSGQLTPDTPKSKKSNPDGQKKGSAGAKGQKVQLKVGHKRDGILTPLPGHVLEQPLIRPRVPVTSCTLKGGTMTPENRVLHAISTLSAQIGKSSKEVTLDDRVKSCVAAAEISDAGLIWRGKERDALRVLFKTMQHEDSKVSMAAGHAVAAIAPCGDDETFREVRTLLSHKLEHVRVSALIALAGSATQCNQAAVDATVSMFEDQSLLVRRRAVVSLAALAPVNHPMLLRSIKSSMRNNHLVWYVRAAACRAVGKVSDATDDVAITLLRDTLTGDSDIRVRIEALEAIVPLTTQLRLTIDALTEAAGTGNSRNNDEAKRNKEIVVDPLSQVKETFAKNVSAVMTAMQDAVGSVDAMFVKLASAKLRFMIGSADEGSDMVLEPHRQEEGYIGDETPQLALRRRLITPDVLGDRLMKKGEMLSPMGGDEEWSDEEEQLSAFVIMDGEILMSSQLTPRRLARALPCPAPDGWKSPSSPLGSSGRRRGLNSPSKRRNPKKTSTPVKSSREAPFLRKRNCSAQKREQEELIAGYSEFDILDRSGVPPPADPYAIKYGTGMVPDSSGLFAELPIDVRQGFGPMRLGVVGRSSYVDVLLFWRRGRIWTFDISDCIIRQSATVGSAAAIRNLEQSSFLSSTNVRTENIFPQLNDTTFRFAAGPLQRSGRSVILFVYSDYALEVPLQRDATSGSVLADTSQPACKFTLEQALGKDFAKALVPPIHKNTDSGSEEPGICTNLDSPTSKPTTAQEEERLTENNPRDEDKTPTAAASDNLETESIVKQPEIIKLSPAAFNTTVWLNVGYCGTGEVQHKNGRIWYLFQTTHVSVFACSGGAEIQSSCLLHAPRPLEKVIHGGPCAVTAAVGPLETVNWAGEGKWKRSKFIFLLHENCVWEWDVYVGNTRRTIRKTDFLSELWDTSLAPSFARAPSHAEDKSIARMESSEKPITRMPSQPSNRNTDAIMASEQSVAVPVKNGTALQQKVEIKKKWISEGLIDVMVEGYTEVTGMPMLRREKKDGPWLLREGVSTPPIHLNLDCRIPSMNDVIGHYVLVDESWADTGRPIYMHISVKRVNPVLGFGSGAQEMLRVPSGSSNARNEGLADIQRLSSVNSSSSIGSLGPAGTLQRRGAMSMRQTNQEIVRVASGGSTQVNNSILRVESSDFGRVLSGNSGQGWDLLRRASTNKSGTKMMSIDSNYDSDHQPSIDMQAAPPNKAAEASPAAQAFANASYASNVQVGTNSRPALFRRKSSIFAPSADDVADIEVNRHVSTARSGSEESRTPLASNTQSKSSDTSRSGKTWDHLRSGTGAGAVLRMAASFSRSSSFTRKESGEVFTRAESGGDTSGIPAPERVPSASGEILRAESNSSVGKNDVEQASFLFWRWPGTGPQDPEAAIRCGSWVVADSPASDEAAFFVESDAWNPTSIDPSAKWLSWNSTDWVAPEGGIRVARANINPAAAKKQFSDAIAFFRRRRVDDETKEEERKAALKEEAKNLQLQSSVITRLQSSGSQVGSMIKRLASNTIARRPSGGSDGSASGRLVRMPSVTRAPSRTSHA